MMNFEEAKKKAKELRKDIDYCQEYEDAYIFSKKDDNSFGGQGPVVILKENGKAINMVAYCNMSDADLVREADL